MASLEWTSRSELEDRECYLLSVDIPADIPADFGLPCEHFVCLLAWEAEGLPVEVVGDVTERLLNAGCSEVCTWGSDCERVHDIFDETIVEREVLRGIYHPKAMTVWEHDPLDEALFYVLCVATMSEEYERTSRAAVVILIDQPPEVEQRVRYALRDPDRFTHEVAEAAEGDESPIVRTGLRLLLIALVAISLLILAVEMD